MIRLRGIKDECFQDYRKTSMVIITCFCDWKCWDKKGENICQNNKLIQEPIQIFDPEYIVKRYLNNPLTHALVIAGLEPLLQMDEILELVVTFRTQCNDDVVIYTGYDMCEIDSNFLQKLSEYENIYLKCGRFIPNHSPHYDEVLGINLASNNQYGVKLAPSLIESEGVDY